MVTRRVKKERERDRDDVDDVLRASGRNDVDVARVVQSRPPPPPPPPRGGEETKTRRRDDAPSPRRLGGGGGVFARRGVLGVVLVLRTYEAARYPGIIIIDSTSPRDWCRMQREQQQRADRERRKEHVRAVRPRQNATAAATEETVPIETTRRGCRCRRELRPSDRYEVRRERKEGRGRTVDERAE